MSVDSLNVRRTVPNCPQLTPAIALYVVPTIFGYTPVIKIWLETISSIFMATNNAVFVKSTEFSY
jgi:hypothetical protein